MGEELPLLSVTNLRKSYGEKEALRGLSFEVRRGEILGLLGVNGAGKTTAMNVILGLTEPDGGGVKLFGKALKEDRVGILKRMNFSSAYVDLPSNLLVWQNLLVFAMMYEVKKPRERIKELLDFLGISEVEKAVTGRLSSGQATRVHLAKALINEPELLLLDEPTASLDPDIADKVRKHVLRLREEQGTTMLYTSHNMKDIEEICDRVVFLHEGKVLAEGSSEEIKQSFQKESLEEVFISVARDGELNAAGGKEEV